METFKNKHITIFGIGKSGLAAARRLIKLGAKIFITESLSQNLIDPDTLAEINKLHIKCEFDGHTLKAIEKTDLIIVSPGIHLDVAILLKAKKKNISIISTLELGSRLNNSPLIAVTGTNGKTTTTTLIAEIIKASGKKVCVAGNIGIPLVGIDKSYDFIVVEVSSYQLESINTFKPFISIMLNLTEDHLERHKSLKQYLEIKSRIFMNQNKSDYYIYNYDDAKLKSTVKNCSANIIPFSRKNKLKNGVCLNSKDEIIFHANGESQIICHKNDIALKGEHNLENVLASISAAAISGIPSNTIRKTLKTFKGVEHRIEFVNTVNGITYINDSKGTNPDSTIMALKALGGKYKNLLLIAGGKDKGTNLEPLISIIKKSCRQVALIGEASTRFSNELIKQGYVNIKLYKSLKNATLGLSQIGRKDDIVLLSPACASFDMFKNFEDRGLQFKQIVNKIKHGQI